MHLLRCLSFFEAHFAVRMVSSYIAGVDNSLADDLSRDRLSEFLQVHQRAHAASSRIVPGCLVELLCNSKPDWTSESWRETFVGTLSMV